MDAPFIRSFIAMSGTANYDARLRVRSAICFRLRSASLTASESGKVSSRSGAIIAIFVPCCTRSSTFPANALPKIEDPQIRVHEVALIHRRRDFVANSTAATPEMNR